MSGIVGLYQRDDTRIDETVFDRLLRQLAFRGPDRQAGWRTDHVALGHTLLATTMDARRQQQPFCFRNRYWLVADSRLDGRVDLIRDLEGAGMPVPEDPTDPELIALAYEAWATDCTHYLLGDFAFALWDQDRKRLFCARDHFGIKPLFYAEVGNSCIVSNSLSCIRQHPGISSRLNEQAMLDFLLFGMNLSLDSSAFSQIKRLPPAHQMIIDASGIRITGYWRLEPSPAIRYRNPADYLQHFEQLQHTAIADRITTATTAIEMSGGMDSTSIAAHAKQIITGSDRPESLRAYTIVYDTLIPDEERYYSALAARHLGIDIEHIAIDDCDLFAGDSESRCQTPEPLDNPYKSQMLDYGQRLSAYSRVCLNGQGADEILRGQPLLSMVGKTSARDILNQLLTCLVHFHHRPPLGLRSLLAGTKQHRVVPPIPRWIRPELVKRLDGQARWERFWQPVQDEPGCLRSNVLPRFRPAYHWTQYVESYDPEMTLAPVEYRWPFLDIRLVRDLLAFPPLPWFEDKFILREAMTDRIPTAIFTRPKTALLGYPFLELLTQQRISRKDIEIDESKIGEFIDFKSYAFPDMYDHGTDTATLQLRPILLYNWLCSIPQD